jgi:ankyrin repeat protein
MSWLNFGYLCERGELFEAQQYYSLHNVDSENWRDSAFRGSCKYGQIEVAKWLISINADKSALYSLGADIHSENDYAFRKSCRNGHIEVAKWLYSLGGVDIHDNEDNVFRDSCTGGHIEVAKWLHSLGGINIHANNDYVFRMSCDKGHIEIVKWLLDISNDKLYSLRGFGSHTKNNAAFDSSCRGEHIEILIFLLSIIDSESLQTNWIYTYEQIEDNVMTKILFDHKVTLPNELMKKYANSKASIVLQISDHLIPDIATMIYYYI